MPTLNTNSKRVVKVFESNGFKVTSTKGGFGQYKLSKKGKEGPGEDITAKKGQTVKVPQELTGMSTKQLREVAKGKIPNFAVLRKDELITALTDPSKVESVTKEAVRRWKAGWSKHKKGNE